MSNPSAAKTVVIVNGGTSDPSTTALLAQRIGDELSKQSEGSGLALEIVTVDLRTIAQDITAALVTGHVGEALQGAIDALEIADGVIAATPVYKAGASGLFSSFFQILDNDLLIGTPVILGGTGGSARHALVVDDQLRGLFGYLRALPTPTGIFAAPGDWTGEELGNRTARASRELLALISSGFRESSRGGGWNGYQHSYGSANGTERSVDFDSELMRLATGG